jgi:hypothetical protein
LFTEAIDLNTAANQGVFDVYLGLTASGYDLANPDRAGVIHKALLAENWSQRTLQYFGFARTKDGRINPYWPRASILTAVSLLIERLPVSSHLTQIQTYLAAMDNISPSDMGSDMLYWTMDLPEQTTIIRKSRAYATAWEYYQQVIQSELYENRHSYQQEMIVAQDRLCILLPPQATLPQLVTILNPLQADPLTDVVNVYNRVYVVSSHLRSESSIHELIHILLSPWLCKWEERISVRVGLLDLVYDRMAYLTYAWDRSVGSWKNVFSETLVRVLTAFASGNEYSESQIGDLVQDGFVYARPIAETIVAMGKGNSLSEEWMDQCLCACAELAKQAKEN